MKKIKKFPFTCDNEVLLKLNELVDAVNHLQDNNDPEKIIKQVKEVLQHQSNNERG